MALKDLRRQFSLIVYANLRQPLAALLKITNLNQSGPQFQRTFDNADDVIHDPHQIVLEEIRFKCIERLVQPQSAGIRNPERGGRESTQA